MLQAGFWVRQKCETSFGSTFERLLCLVLLFFCPIPLSIMCLTTLKHIRGVYSMMLCYVNMINHQLLCATLRVMLWSWIQRSVLKICLCSSDSWNETKNICFNEYVQPPGINMQGQSFTFNHQTHLSRLIFDKISFCGWMKQNREKRLVCQTAAFLSIYNHQSDTNPHTLSLIA